MVDEQIKNVREFLSIASLTVLEEKSLAVSFRSYSGDLSKSNIVNANAMVQIAINRVLKTEAPKFNRKKFEKAVAFALTQTDMQRRRLFRKKNTSILRVKTDRMMNSLSESLQKRLRHKYKVIIG